jgi:hypothetical protein
VNVSSGLDTGQTVAVGKLLSVRTRLTERNLDGPVERRRVVGGK